MITFISDDNKDTYHVVCIFKKYIFAYYYFKSINELLFKSKQLYYKRGFNYTSTHVTYKP